MFDCELEEFFCEENFELGDYECFFYYVKKDKIFEFVIIGKLVCVLCGKKWILGCDLEKFLICFMCKEIYELMIG